jgi:MerR family transcriptional regulator, redox-sensitive transcriptional activator SoxR
VTLSISEVAARSGLRASALRYYEEIGLIRPAGRRGGRRHFDPDVLPRLAFIALAQSVGFTLDEVVTLVDGRPGARERWRKLAENKLGELERQLEKLQGMKRLLEAALACNCDRVDGCELVDGAAGGGRCHHNEKVHPDLRSSAF